MGRHKVAFACGPLLGVLENRRALPAAPVFRQPCGSTWQDPRRINRHIRATIAEIPDGKIPTWKLHGDDSHIPFRFHGSATP